MIQEQDLICWMNGYILGKDMGQALEVQPLPVFDWSLEAEDLLDSGRKCRWLWTDVSSLIYGTGAKPYQPSFIRWPCAELTS